MADKLTKARRDVQYLSALLTMTAPPRPTMICQKGYCNCNWYITTLPSRLERDGEMHITCECNVCSRPSRPEYKADDTNFKDLRWGRFGD